MGGNPDNTVPPTRAARPSLVVGATGKLGAFTVRLLIQNGLRVRAMTRQPSRAEHLLQPGVEIVQGDLRDARSLSCALEGVEHVIAAAHAATGRGKNNPSTVDRAGHRSLIDAAVAAEVRHFVFVSARGAASDHPIDFFRIKHETEQYLKSSGLSFTILRASAFMETWVEIVGEPLVRKGKTVIFGDGTNPINFVSVKDVSRFVLMALQKDELRNRSMDVGGPQNLTMAEVAHIFARVSGRSAKERHVPVPVLRLMSFIVRPFSSLAYRMLAAGIMMSTSDQTFDMTETLRRYPMRLTRLEDVAGECLGTCGASEP